jgi:competence protein CoiA
MQIALVNGSRSIAAPGLLGVCQLCASPMIAKCGSLRIWHWAHENLRQCDPWWEESKWHATWKSRFPAECREVPRRDRNGEKHIADVRLPDGRVIEFQHSRLKNEERHAREFFYGSMMWVVDGLARKNDRSQFENTLRRMSENPTVYSGWKECALLRDWVGRPVDVFFDFGEPTLWQLHPSPGGGVILTPVPIEVFIEKLHTGMPFERIRIKRSETPAPTVPPAPIAPTPLYRRRRRF